MPLLGSCGCVFCSDWIDFQGLVVLFVISSTSYKKFGVFICLLLKSIFATAYPVCVLSLGPFCYGHSGAIEFFFCVASTVTVAKVIL
jgi:hypothetical protein